MGWGENLSPPRAASERIMLSTIPVTANTQELRGPNDKELLSRAL